MQGRIWMLTIPKASWTPVLPESCAYVRGQGEVGNGGYEHWQILCHFKRSVRLAAVKKSFGRECHAELSRSEAAEQYVWKEDTRVEGSQFEFGTKPVRRNVARDWEQVWELAKSGDIDQCDASIRICHYRTLQKIASDYSQPVAIVRKIFVYWGPTGTGKSRRAWDEASLEAYPKDPRSKFWDGYRGQENVVFDEFRGGIDISHILRWCDRYPTLVEIKGSSTVLKAKKIWFTSNLHPRDWYPLLDEETKLALLRRLEIVEIK